MNRSPVDHQAPVPDNTLLDDVDGLTYRELNVLRHGGFKTAGDVRRASDERLLRVRQLGKVSLRGIRRRLGHAPVCRLVPHSSEQLFLGLLSNGRALVGFRHEPGYVSIGRLPSRFAAEEPYPLYEMSDQVARQLAQWLTQGGADDVGR